MRSILRHTDVREGSTWELIFDTAKEEHADMIVMGSQRRTGLSHALIGSVAEKIAVFI